LMAKEFFVIFFWRGKGKGEEEEEEEEEDMVLSLCERKKLVKIVFVVDL
jgi:hypothetical protein